MATAEVKWDPAVDPVLCDPYLPPDRHWELGAIGEALPVPPLQGRRPPLHIAPPQDRKAGRGQQKLYLSDRRENVIVSQAREEVARWRMAGYKGATATTIRLLRHWNDPQATRLRPFFAQIEAVETVVWLREVVTRGNPLRRQIEQLSRNHNDGIVRFCAKMATGTGKTAVMGMVIAWQTLNAANSPRRRNIIHTNRFLVLAPGHTVRARLGVLVPSASDNVYEEMGLVPEDMRRRLNQAKVRVINYQAFARKELIGDGPARALLGKAKGQDTESWEAAVRRVLGDDLLSPGVNGLSILNDEAHHCYLPPERNTSDANQKAEDRRASVWFNAIRTLRDMGALGSVSRHGQANAVLDFSATPLWIDTAAKSEPDQFQWVVSDFGLMDAIESGLVKVPRVPVDDDSTRDETVWRKLYDNTKPAWLPHWFKADKNRGSLPEALGGAVEAVVKDWERKLIAWRDDGQPTPPVIIFVVNTIVNATALYRHIAGYEDEDGIPRPGAHAELSNVDDMGRWHPELRTLIVHSKAAAGDTIPTPLKDRVSKSRDITKKEAEVAVREMLNTVGKTGRLGAQVRCVISVSMLTEGWDARTVTHIVGFRAFGSQLLCEQVTGRALRRTSYDDLRDPDAEGRRRFEPQYADVVGIPFEFMPAAREPDPTPKPPKPRTTVYSVPGREQHRVSWPNVTEYLRVARQGHFRLNPERVARWSPEESKTAMMAELKGVAGEWALFSSQGERQKTARVELAKEMTKRLTVDLPGASDGSDRQTMREMGRTALFRSAYRAVEDWSSHPLVAVDDLWDIAGNSHLRSGAAETVLAACDFGVTQESRRAGLSTRAVKHTADIRFETTLAKIGATRRSELSHAACHSGLELATAKRLDLDRRVARWVRNFQLGWTLPYYLDGAWSRYEPDFVAVLDNGMNLLLECKGVWDGKAKAAAIWTRDHWIPCVAGTGELPDELRRWHYAVIDDPDSVAHQLDLAINQALRI